MNRSEEGMSGEAKVELEAEGYVDLTELRVVDDVDERQFDGPVVALRDPDGRLYILRLDAARALDLATARARAAA
jgi:hypothetical protein